MENPDKRVATPISGGNMSFPARKLRVEEVKGDEPTAPVAPTKAYSEFDSRYVRVELPSLFHFYPFKQLSIRPISALEQAKLNRANKEGKLQHLVDAVSATLEPGISAYSLTPSDFYYLMYWLRVNSYSKVPYNHRSLCKNPNHVAEVMEDKLPPSSLEISMLLTNSTLSQSNLNPLTLAAFSDSLGSHYTLGSATMADIQFITDLDVESDVEESAPKETLTGTSVPALGSEEWLWLADRAQHLRCDSQGRTDLQARIVEVMGMSPDDIQEMEEYMQVASDYGVTEKISIRCEVCGAETETEVSISALSFLPDSRRVNSA